MNHNSNDEFLSKTREEQLPPIDVDLIGICYRMISDGLKIIGK